METIVRNGKFFTVGDDGAGFYPYKKGDIIFNHKQTEELFKNGKVTSNGGRGKAFASGTAFSNGSGASRPTYSNTHSVKSNTSSSKKKGSRNNNNNNDKEKNDNIIDWIAIAINRVERAIDSLDLKAKSVYKTWTSRNDALINQIDKVREEIDLQQKAYNRYIQEANSVGLDSSTAEKVREGKIDIEKITDENLKTKIDDYQKYFEAALDCKKAIEDLKETEAELIKQRFDNVSAQYEGILGVIEHEKNMLDEHINQAETQSWLVSSNYYKALESNERKNISQLEKEKASMLSELQNAMSTGKIAEKSEAWYEMINAIDEVTLSIAQSQTQLLEYEQTLQQLGWEVFDILQEKISSVTEESNFLIDLMSNEKLHEDNGQLTDKGMATMGLHGQNYNVYMAQADKARQEAEKLKKELEKDPFDTELESRYREMIALQQEHIMNAEGEKNAIKDLVEKGIELELNSLQELIDKYNDALDSQKDLYDYQKRVKEQVKEIASLEKQLSAYQGDKSEETQSKLQQIKVDLENAKDELKESEYERYISDQKTMLDELYLSYEETLNTRLDNIDALVSDMITEINTNASTISTTISTEAQNVGYTLSESMKTIWNESSVSTNNVIANYGDKFLNANTTTNNALNAINTNLQNMINQLNAMAKTNIKSASTSSASNSTQASKPSSKPTQNPNNSKPTNSEPSKTIKVGGKINAGNAQIYDYKDDKSGERQYYRKDPIYTVLKEVGGWLQVRYHKLSKGITGWFKKGDVKAYKNGKKDIDNNHVAWTQEQGEEFIVRPSDGAILTPVAKGDSVLNARASKNIWDMANTPTEFIKNNLGLGNANVPNNSNIQNNYTQNLDNIVFNFPNVKNYNELLSTMQKDKNFEKLILSMSIDRLAGKSSLAKNKVIKK